MIKKNALIPKYSFNSNTGEYKILGSDRDADSKFAKASLLSKIIYPTGGESSFEYEGHDYSMKINRTPSTKFIKELKPEKGIIGGARIKKIIDTDERNTSIIREFKYINENKLSSGIALDDIRYLYYNDFKNIGNRRTKQAIEKNINYFSSSLSSSPIEYGRVLEYKNNIPYKEYLFSTYETYPDSLSYVMKAENTKADFKPENMNRNLELKYLDFSNRRRLKLKETFFNNLGQIIKEIEYGYTLPRKNQSTFANDIFRKEHTVSVLPMIYGTYYYIDYYNYPLIKRKTERYFFSNTIIENSDKYTYKNNNSLGVQTISTFFSDKTSKVTTYQYAHEKGNKYLIDKNMIGIPLETTILKNGKIVSKTETQYPTSLEEANHKTKGLPLPLSILSSNLDNDAKKEDVAYTRYDDKGNLIEYKINGITSTAIVYGYHQTLPIAKIEGAAYDEIKNYISAVVEYSNLDKDETSENDLLLALQRLRNNNNFSNFQITTYTHDPLIGVTSITPPSGITEYYKYDFANRLEKVVDINGNILREYQYKYKQ